jgi:hypothetical protein
MKIKWLLAFLPLALATLSAATAQMADVAGVLPGDRWVYELKDEITGDLKSTTTVVVLDVSDNEINTRLSVRGVGRPQQVVFDRSWNRIDDSIWKYRPSDGTGVRTPLQVGKDWRFENNATHFQNGTALSTTGQSKVVSEEKLTTSAGTFETFKIETTMRQLNSNDQTKAASVTSALWYAPSINRWVRKTYSVKIEGRLRDSHTEELVEYSRKP